jgi:hypothetical protein
VCRQDSSPRLSAGRHGSAGWELESSSGDEHEPAAFQVATLPRLLHVGEWHRHGVDAEFAFGGQFPQPRERLEDNCRREAATAAAHDLQATQGRGGSLRIGPAISPIWMRRVLVGSAIRSWPVRAAIRALVYPRYC